MKITKSAEKLINYYLNDQQFRNLCNLSIKKVVDADNITNIICYCSTDEFIRIQSIYTNILHINYFQLDYFLDGIKKGDHHFSSIFYNAGAKAIKTYRAFINVTS